MSCFTYGEYGLQAVQLFKNLIFVMDKLIKTVEQSFEFPHEPIPDFGPGDVIEAHIKIVEKNKERIQKFEGVVIEARIKRCGIGHVLIRKVSNNVAVERIIPIPSPNVVKVVLKRRAIVRRAKLSYLQRLDSNTKAKLKYRVKL